jgi:hypothetical protein
MRTILLGGGFGRGASNRLAQPEMAGVVVEARMPNHAEVEADDFFWCVENA